MQKIILNLTKKVIMLTLEGAYSLVYKNILRAVNPLKKRVVKTECIVHQAINNQSLHILRNDGYFDVYNLMSTYIDTINDGVVWADQDLKSSNHLLVQRLRGAYMAIVMLKMNVSHIITGR
jgi:hypothetical protein